MEFSTTTAASLPLIETPALAVGIFQDGILSPEHIADNYWYLHQQPRDAWTFELDLRPYMEKW